MGYRLFTLYALFKLDNDPGHIKSARPLMDDFVKRASDVRDRIGNEMSPATHFKINCTIRGETDYTCRPLHTISHVNRKRLTSATSRAD